MGTHQKEERGTGNCAVRWRSGTGVILATDGLEPRIVLRLGEVLWRGRFCEAGAGVGPKPSRPVSDRGKNGKTGEQKKTGLRRRHTSARLRHRTRPGDGAVT